MLDQKENKMDKYGLIGKNIDYSFSRAYFNEKFKLNKIDAKYVNFDLDSLDDLATILKQETQLKGLNVTIPYKEEIISFLDELDPHAEAIGAVNCIRVESGKLKGYNTDYIGFRDALIPLLEKHHKKALILGSGGAAKAVQYALDELGIEHKTVSRTKTDKTNLTYEDLDKTQLKAHKIIINTTPLGTYPNVDSYPNLAYEHLDEQHILYDLTYNPEITKFLAFGQKQATKTINGYQMLVNQAEEAWKIWSKLK